MTHDRSSARDFAVPVFHAVLAAGIGLWEASLEEERRIEWNTTRYWCSGQWSPAQLIALAGAKAALRLYEDADTKVSEYAWDYLWRLFRSDVVQEVDSLMWDLVTESVPLFLEFPSATGTSYRVFDASDVRYRVLELKHDPVLARFIDGMTEIYPEIAQTQPPYAELRHTVFKEWYAVKHARAA